jgi:hypothetical protein
VGIKQVTDDFSRCARTIDTSIHERDLSLDKGLHEGKTRVIPLPDIPWPQTTPQLAESAGRAYRPTTPQPTRRFSMRANSMKYTYILFLIAGFAATTHAVDHPNIILLLSDDQRDGTFGAMGHKFVQTPHTDKLIRGGVRFANTYIASPVCAQSRISLFTGVPERVHGVGFSSAYKLTDQQWKASYPALVRQAGYHTGFIGKYGVLYHTFKAEEAFDFWYAHHGWTKFLPKDHNHRDTKPYHDAKNNIITPIMGEAVERFLETRPTRSPSAYPSASAFHTARRRQACSPTTRPGPE